MAYIGGNQNVDFSRENIQYDYPGGLKLKPTGKLHKKIVQKVMSMSGVAASNISTRFDSWNEIDRTLTAYIPLDDAELEMKDNDSRKPTSIVFPNSYAILETIMSYMLDAFLQDPIFQYEGTGPEDTIGAILLEKCIQLHCLKNKIMLDIHTWIRDSLSYGVGFVAPYWKTDYGFQTVMKEEPIGPFGMLGKRKVKSVEEALLFEGNALENIDVYNALPDPDVPIHKLQEGESFGWVKHTNYYDLLDKERHGNGEYFNVRYLKKLSNRSTSIYGGDNSSREEKNRNNRRRRYGGTSVGRSHMTPNDRAKPVDLINRYVKLIPQEWGLGSSEYPEKWLFTVAADCVVVRAKPLGLDHNLFPIASAAPDFDGYSSIPNSRLEMLNGLQRILDWMYNTHITNVRRTVNDQLVYDPYLINSRDINSTEAGKRIRIRPPGWGRPDVAKNAVWQIPVNDVTRQHVGDANWIVQGMKTIGGADASAMGELRQGGPERLTSAEFQGTKVGQVSRLSRIARVFGMQGMQDVGTMFACHTKQLMTQDQFIKITGRWQETLIRNYGVKHIRQNNGRINVSPFDLLVNYDVIVRDGSVPGGNYSNVWLDLFKIISGDEQLRQEYDHSRIFKHIAQNNGAKNIEEFVRIRVEEDETVEEEAQKGNLVPYNIAAGEVAQ